MGSEGSRIRKRDRWKSLLPSRSRKSTLTIHTQICKKSSDHGIAESGSKIGSAAVHHAHAEESATVGASEPDGETGLAEMPRTIEVLDENDEVEPLISSIPRLQRNGSRQALVDLTALVSTDVSAGNEKHSVILQSIWSRALAALSSGSEEQQASARTLCDLAADDKGPLKGRQVDGIAVIEHLQALARAKHEAMRKYQLTCFGRDWNISEVIGNIAAWFNRFKEVGDVISSFDPHHMALPWAAVRFLLQAVTASQEQSALLFVGIERITHLYFRCEIYIHLYLSEPGAASSEKPFGLLESSVVDMFASILSFLALAVDRCKANAVKQAVDGTFSMRKVSDHLTRLDELERRVDSAAGACDWLLSYDLRGKTTNQYEKLTRLLNENLLWEGKQLDSLLPAAGAGKTILSSKVVDCLEHHFKWRCDIGLAYFFCDQNRRSHQDPLSVLCSLVRQLSVTRDHKNIMTCTEEIYSKKQMAGFASNRLKWDECLSLLIQLTNTYEETCIVIDGLDECDKDTRYKLFDIIQQLTRQSSGMVKLFVASRDDEDIKHQYMNGRDLLISSTDNQADIAKFVTSKIEENRWCKQNLSRGVRNEILTAFSEKSQGMFLWAKLMVDGLLQLKLEKDILRYLRDLPRGMKSAYDNIYEEIQEREGSADELARFIAMDLEMEFDAYNCPITVDYILDACRNLLVVTKSNICRFAHLSVQEYFEQHRYTQEQANRFVSKMCLRYLTSEQLFSRQIEPATMAVCKSMGEYAAGWPYHWINSNAESGDEVFTQYFYKLLKDPLYPCALYRHWITLAASQNLQVTRSLIEIAAQYNLNSYTSPIFTCCFLGIDQVMREWFESDSLESDVKTHLSTKLLSLAADRNHINLCRLFLKSGADVNRSYGSVYVRPPLHLAARHGSSHSEVVRLLLQHGANPNLETDFFGTALEGALGAQEPLGIVKILVRNGATLGLDKFGRRVALEALLSRID
ncbi:hypothetical protein DL771_011735 [Monosporascus sp. 5C6A]|nr:hypothetical protein DL771_011735 [Monosporascus sp. 5C6A]